MTLDEIYELFIWDASYTDQEYEERTNSGINEAIKFKYLYPFIQPIIPQHGKSIWEPCAKVVAAKSDDELEPYLFSLIEWLQDMNWPGAYIIFDRLAKIPSAMLESALRYGRLHAQRDHDITWLTTLKDLEEKIVSK